MLFVWEVCCFGLLVDLFSVLFCDIMLCELTLLNFLVLCVALRLMFYIKILVYLIVCCVIKRFFVLCVSCERFNGLGVENTAGGYKNA